MNRNTQDSLLNTLNDCVNYLKEKRLAATESIKEEYHARQLAQLLSRQESELKFAYERIKEINITDI